MLNIQTENKTIIITCMNGEENSEEQRNNNILKEKIAWRTKVYICVNKWRSFQKNDIEVDWNSWWRELTYVKDIMELKECKKEKIRNRNL